MAEQKALLIGVSGASSSGKTTLSRLLRDIFPNTFILHEDDFYKGDAEIPTKDDVADWDCLEAINLPSLEDTLRHIREHGKAPSNLHSKEDLNSVGDIDIDRALIDDLGWRAGRWMFKDVPPIAIVDGFLLYAESMKQIRDLFDVKLFLRTDFATAKRRREARNGYVTLDGFWEDPPGYVEKVVWPNYVKDHAFLFAAGDVEGEPRHSELERLHIHAMPTTAQGDMTACLKWAYDIIEHELIARYSSK